MRAPEVVDEGCDAFERRRPAEPEGDEPGGAGAAAGQQLVREPTAQLGELGAEALGGTPFPLVLAGGGRESGVQPREVEHLAGVPVRRGDLGGRDRGGRGDVRDVERCAEMREAGTGVGEDGRYSSARELGGAGVAARALTVRERGFGGREGALEALHHRLERPDARVGREEPTDAALDGRDERRDEPWLAGRAGFAGARRESVRIGQRVHHDERAHDLRRACAGVAHRAGHEGGTHEVHDAVGDGRRDDLAPQAVQP